MPVADSKKVASAVNHIGQAAQAVRGAVLHMQDYDARLTAANPSTVDTPLQGNRAALSAAITALASQINNPIWDTVINAISKSHRGEAL